MQEQTPDTILEQQPAAAAAKAALPVELVALSSMA